MVTSAETSAAILQMERCFNEAIEATLGPLPTIDGVDSIVFAPETSHPLTAHEVCRKATLHRATRTYYVRAPFDYIDWVSTDWPKRLAAYSKGVLASVSALPKSRVSEGQRETLMSAIERAQDFVEARPPSKIEPVLPVYICRDSSGKVTSLRLADRPASFGADVTEIPPQEAVQYVGVQLWPAVAPQMFKLYRRGDDGELLYREAWFDRDRVTEHFGRCGDRGQTRDHVADAKTAGTTLDRLKKLARKDGFKAIPGTRMHSLVIEYPIAGFGAERDLARRHALEDYFNELVGWLGLGHLDGGSTGSDSMEVVLIVVDFEIARAAIEKTVRGAKGDGYTRIYRMR